MDIHELFKNDLISVEQALFSLQNKIKYCLIQTSQKYYYISESNSIAGVISRIRSVARNDEVNATAYALQKTVRATNLADWRIIIFADVDLPDGYIEDKLRGYTRIHKAKRYEVHAKADAMGYYVRHSRTGVELYMTVAGDPDDGIINSRAKRLIRDRIKRHESRTNLKSAEKSALILLMRAAIHAARGEWSYTEIPLSDEDKQNPAGWTSAKNKRFENLLFVDLPH